MKTVVNIFLQQNLRERDYWINEYSEWHIELPKGSIKKLIGRELSWSDEPVELK